jgi:hypothetical protein
MQVSHGRSGQPSEQRTWPADTCHSRPANTTSLTSEHGSNHDDVTLSWS